MYKGQVWDLEDREMGPRMEIHLEMFSMLIQVKEIFTLPRDRDG